MKFVCGCNGTCLDSMLPGVEVPTGLGSFSHSMKFVTPYGLLPSPKVSSEIKWILPGNIPYPDKIHMIKTNITSEALQ